MSQVKDQKIADMFRALGHPVRLQIVRQLLEDGACYAGDISSQLPVAASTTSQHLKILKDSGVITGTIDGPHRCYCVNKPAMLDLRDWVKSL